MASLLPSDVTRLIDKLFTWVSADRQVVLNDTHLAEVAALVDAL
jgi:hypothetical protein